MKSADAVMEQGGAHWERLRSILATQFEVPAERVVPTARLREDLELDSLDHIDLVLELERFAGRRIPSEELRQLATIGDVLALMARLGSTPSPAAN